MCYTLYVMVGLPASGKTTAAKKNCDNAYPHSAIHISRDEIRYSLLKNYEEYFSREKEVFNIYIKKIINAIKENINFIYIDATHLTESSRKKLLNNIVSKIGDIGLLKKYDLEFIVMNTPILSCYDRNKNRSGIERVPDSVIFNFKKNMVNPTLEEFEDYEKYFNTIKISYIIDNLEDFYTYLEKK